MILLSVLSYAAPYLGFTMAGIHYFSISSKRLDPCQSLKGPFCDFKGLVQLVPLSLGKEPAMLSKTCFCPLPRGEMSNSAQGCVVTFLTLIEGGGLLFGWENPSVQQVAFFTAQFLV